MTNEKAAASAFIKAQEALKIIEGAAKKDLVPALVEWKRRLKRDDTFAAIAFTATKVVKHEKPTRMTSAVLHPIVVAPINDEEGDRAHQPGGAITGFEDVLADPPPPGAPQTTASSTEPSTVRRCERTLQHLSLIHI